MTDSLIACPECGHPNANPKARFCAECGGALVATGSEPALPTKGAGAPDREALMARLEKLRENPRYQEAMGTRASGAQVLAHRVEGRRNGFLILLLALGGYVLYVNGYLKAPLERFGPGPLFALGAFGLFVLSRSSRRTFDMAGPAQSREAVVVSKRHQDRPNGPGRPEDLDTKYYVTLMDRQGVQEELCVKRSLHKRLKEKDAGAAYIKGRTLLRFETVE